MVVWRKNRWVMENPKKKGRRNNIGDRSGKIDKTVESGKVDVICERKPSHPLEPPTRESLREPKVNWSLNILTERQPRIILDEESPQTLFLTSNSSLSLTWSKKCDILIYLFLPRPPSAFCFPTHYIYPHAHPTQPATSSYSQSTHVYYIQDVSKPYTL